MSSITSTFDTMRSGTHTQNLMPIRSGFFQENRFSLSVQETVMCFPGAAKLAAYMIPHLIYDAQSDAIIGFYFNINIHSRPKSGHRSILRIRIQHRTYDSGCFHTVITKSYPTKKFCPRLFKPPNIIAVMHTSHLVCLIILYHMRIWFKLIAHLIPAGPTMG